MKMKFVLFVLIVTLFSVVCGEASRFKRAFIQNYQPGSARDNQICTGNGCYSTGDVSTRSGSGFGYRNPLTSGGYNNNNNYGPYPAGRNNFNYLAARGYGFNPRASGFFQRNSCNCRKRRAFYQTEVLPGCGCGSGYGFGQQGQNNRGGNPQVFGAGDVVHNFGK